MNVFVPNVMWVDENKQWLALYYPHLPLTKKRLKEYRREKVLKLKEFSNGICTCSTINSDDQLSIFDFIEC